MTLETELTVCLCSHNSLCLQTLMSEHWNRTQAWTSEEEV